MACSSTPAPRQVARAPAIAELEWNDAIVLPALEKISAEVSVLGVRAGVFDFELAQACDAPRGDIEIRSRMSTVGVVRFFKATDGSSLTVLDPRDARPRTSDLLVLDGTVTRRYQARHEPGAAETTYVRSGQSPKHETERIPSGEHPLDMPSAFLLLRYWSAEPGTEGYFYALLGKDLWRVSVRARGERRLELQGRKHSTLLVTGSARRVDPKPEQADDQRRFSIWLTNDASRTPLRLEGDVSFGKVHMELKTHESEPAQRQACVRTPRTAE